MKKPVTKLLEMCIICIFIFLWVISLIFFLFFIIKLAQTPIGFVFLLMGGAILAGDIFVLFTFPIFITIIDLVVYKFENKHFLSIFNVQKEV